MELVDTTDLKSVPFGGIGSTPIVSRKRRIVPMVERRFPKSTDKGSNPFSPEKKIYTKKGGRKKKFKKKGFGEVPEWLNGLAC